MNIETFLGIAGAFGGLEALKWLAGLRSSRRKAAAEAAECFENVVTKRVKTYEDSLVFLQNQLQEKERQFAELSAQYQESMRQGLKLTRELGDIKLKYRQSRCDRKECEQRKPPFSWMKKGVRKSVAAGVIGIMVILAATGCTKKIYVPVESERIMSERAQFASLQRDTVLERDSVWIKIKGDTVVKEAWRMRERVKIFRDTVQIVRNDTVVSPRIVEMERSRSKGG